MMSKTFRLALYVIILFVLVSFPVILKNGNKEIQVENNQNAMFDLIDELHTKGDLLVNGVSMISLKKEWGEIYPFFIPFTDEEIKSLFKSIIVYRREWSDFFSVNMVEKGKIVYQGYIFDYTSNDEAEKCKRTLLLKKINSTYQTLRRTSLTSHYFDSSSEQNYYSSDGDLITFNTSLFLDRYLYDGFDEEVLKLVSVDEIDVFVRAFILETLVIKDVYSECGLLTTPDIPYPTD